MSITDVGLQQIAAGWKDSFAEVTTRATGPGRPTYEAIVGNFYGYKFALNDAHDQRYHINHDHKPSAGAYLHVHWLSDGTNGNSVKWEWTVAHAKGHAQGIFNFGSPLVVTAEQAIVNPATALRHYVTEIATPILEGSIEPDTVIATILKRITNGGTDNTDRIFVEFLDFHYQSDRIATLNRSPNFYA